MSENQIKKRPFDEQEYLIWHHIKKNARKRTKSKINLSKLDGTGKLYKVVGNYTPANFISKINRPKKEDRNLYRDFLDLETHKISALVPDISLYRVLNGQYVPFYFPVAADPVTPQSILTPGMGINGVGIKSLNLSFTGNNPFSFDKQIKCDLVIFVDNLQSIFNDPPEGYAPLAELFTISRGSHVPLKSGDGKPISIEQLHRPFSHEISARIGYNVDSRSRLFSQEERDAIVNSAISLRMTLYDHSISVNQEGTATISISYIGRLDGLKSDHNLDLLSDIGGLSTRGKTIKDTKGEKKVDATSKEAKAKERMKRVKETHTSMRKFFTYLDPKSLKFDKKTNSYPNSRIYKYEISNKDIAEFLSFGDLSLYAEQISNIRSTKNTATAPMTNEIDRLRKKLADLNRTNPANAERRTARYEKKIAKEQKKISAVQKSYDQQATKQTVKNKSLHYVYVGDLVESVFYNMKNSVEKAISEVGKNNKPEESGEKAEGLRKSLDQLKKMNVLFGTVPLMTRGRGVVMINMADIPLSLNTLQKYFFDEIEQRHRQKFPIKKFLDDLTSKLIPEALNGRGSKSSGFISSTTNIRTVNITGPNLKSSIAKKTEVDVDDLPDFIRKRESKTEKDESEYYVVYAEIPEKAPSGLRGDLLEDIQQGIYHFHIGKDRGLLKSIQFSKDEVPYRKEALMIESVSLYDELKMPYTADISMVGNNLFLPGTQIYINPSSLGFGDPRNRRSAASRLGIGGYYQVITVGTNFDGVSMTTQLNAMYTSWADNDKAFAGEMAAKAQTAVDSSPESQEVVLETSTNAPVFEPIVGQDYETIRSSFFLTEEEKQDIIHMDTSDKQIESDSVVYQKKPNGSRIYTVRGERQQPIYVTINPNRSVKITKKSEEY